MNNLIEMLNNEPNQPEYLVLNQIGVEQTYPIHTHSFYEFFLVTEGYALHVVNSTTHLIKRGSLVLIRPRDVHFYDFYKSNTFEFYNVGLSVQKFEFFNRFFNGALNPLDKCEIPKHVIIDNALTDQLEKLLLQIKKHPENGSDSPAFNILAATVCYTILTNDEQEPQGYMPEWLFHLREEMEKQENFIAGLPRLLELAKYSQEYVNRMFRRYMNITPTHFINEKRLTYARDLLKTSKLPLSVICEQCGFRNLSYFYGQYKARFGCTPRQNSTRYK